MKNDSYQPPFPQVITREVSYRDVETQSGRPLRISDNVFMFRAVDVREER